MGSFVIERLDEVKSWQSIFEICGLPRSLHSLAKTIDSMDLWIATNLLTQILAMTEVSHSLAVAVLA